jgi:hypothetical protein
MVIVMIGEEGVNYVQRWISQLCFLKTNKMGISITTGIMKKHTFVVIIKTANIPRDNIKLLMLTRHDNLGHQG